MSDQLLFIDSNESQKVSEPFVSKQVCYIIDQNNSSYSSGQVQIDTSSLSNSGKYCSFSESYLVVPWVVALYPLASDSAFGTKAANWAVSMKNGYHNIIHSFSVEYNNTTVCQTVPFSNHYISYKLNQSLSQDDIAKVGPTIGFYPDTPDSWSFNTSATPDGKGECNNRNFGFENLYPTNNGRIFTTADIIQPAGPVAVANTALGTPVDMLYTTNYPRYGTATGYTAGTSFLPPASGNFGMYQRQKNYSFNPAVAPWSNLLSTTNTRALYKSYFASGGATAATGYKVWYITAIIRLKDMHDLFQELPLVKGAYLRFIINFNVGSATVEVGTQAAAGSAAPLSDNQTPAAITLEQKTISITGGGSCPVMLASASPGNGSDGLATTGTTLKLAWGIYTLSLTDTAAGGDVTLTHPLNSCRLYVPLIGMTPIAEQAYLSAHKTKTVSYRDLFNYRVTNVPSGDNFQNLLTNGIICPKSIVILPYFTNDDSTGNPGGYLPYQSVFSTAPATTSPLTALTDFNVQVAGMNMLLLNETYEWQNFVDETQHAHALNGGLVTGLTSGLVSQYSWSQLYRAYTINIGRRLAAEDLVPKSILLLGRNMSSRAIDLMCFVETQRQISVDLNILGSVLPKAVQVSA
jgi:hypothetical protein